MPKVLDSQGMKALGDFLGSSAKTEILRALHCQPDAVGLRQLARIAGVRVRSAELALHNLVSEGLVTRRRAANHVFYAMDRHHPGAVVLGAAFDAAALAAIRVSSRSLDVKAKRILPFVRQALRMLNRARESRYEA